MNKRIILAAFTALIFMTGCAGPRITGSSISAEILATKPEVLSINDKETREGFQAAVETWLAANQYSVEVQQHGAKHNPEKITLEYTGTWRWDMALYLSTAKIDAYYQGQRLANVSFAAPNSLNTNKWGSAESRIALMLDVLFGKTTAPEATKRL